MKKIIWSILIISSVAYAASSDVSVSCLGENASLKRYFKCISTSSSDALLMTSNEGSSVIVLENDASPSSSINVSHPSIGDKRGGIRKIGDSVEVVDGSGRVTHKDYTAENLDPYSYSSANISAFARIPYGEVNISSVSPVEGVSSGAVVFIGDAKKINIDASGREGFDGRSPNTAAALQIARGELGSSEDITSMMDKLSLSPEVNASPYLETSDIAQAGGDCKSIDPDLLPLRESSDKTHLVAKSERAMRLTATRSMCERQASMEYNIQTLCARPSEVKVNMTCDYPRIIKNVPIWRKPLESVVTSFTCKDTLPTGNWELDCKSQDYAVVASALRPRAISLEPASSYTPIVATRPLYTHTGHTRCRVINQSLAVNGASILAEYGVNVDLTKQTTLEDCSSQSLSIENSLRAAGYAVADWQKNYFPLSVEDTKANYEAMGDAKILSARYWADAAKAKAANDTNFVYSKLDSLNGASIPLDYNSLKGEGIIDSLKTLGYNVSFEDMVISHDGVNISKSNSETGRTLESIIKENICTDASNCTAEEKLKLNKIFGGESTLDGSYRCKDSSYKKENGDCEIGYKDEFSHSITYTFNNLSTGVSLAGQGSNNPLIFSSKVNSFGRNLLYISGDINVEPIKVSKYCKEIKIDDGLPLLETENNESDVNLGKNYDKRFQFIFPEYMSGDGVKMKNFGTKAAKAYNRSGNAGTFHDNEEADFLIFARAAYGGEVPHAGAKSDETRAYTTIVNNAGATFEDYSNTLTNYGSSFVRVKKLEPTCIGGEIDITHEISAMEKAYADQFRKLNGVLIVSKENEIKVYFNPLKLSYNASTGDVSSNIYVNTSTSAGLYLPYLSMAPYMIEPLGSYDSTADFGADWRRGFAIYGSLPDVSYPAANGGSTFTTISQTYNENWSLKAEAAKKFRYYGVLKDKVSEDKANREDKRHYPLKKWTADLTLSDSGSLHVNYPRYIKTLESLKMVGDQNSSFNKTKLNVRNYDALLGTKIIFGENQSGLTRNCSSIVSKIKFPSQLISSVINENTTNDFDVNRADFSGEFKNSVPEKYRRYFSPNFLPKSLSNTEKYESIPRNEDSLIEDVTTISDPINLGQDYNSYLASLEQDKDLYKNKMLNARGNKEILTITTPSSSLWISEGSEPLLKTSPDAMTSDYIETYKTTKLSPNEKNCNKDGDGNKIFASKWCLEVSLYGGLVHNYIPHMVHRDIQYNIPIIKGEINKEHPYAYKGVFLPFLVTKHDLYRASNYNTMQQLMEPLSDPFIIGSDEALGEINNSSDIIPSFFKVVAFDDRRERKNDGFGGASFNRGGLNLVPFGTESSVKFARFDINNNKRCSTYRAVFVYESGTSEVIDRKRILDRFECDEGYGSSSVNEYGGNYAFGNSLVASVFSWHGGNLMGTGGYYPDKTSDGFNFSTSKSGVKYGDLYDMGKHLYNNEEPTENDKVELAKGGYRETSLGWVGMSSYVLGECSVDDALATDRLAIDIPEDKRTYAGSYYPVGISEGLNGGLYFGVLKGKENPSDAEKSLALSFIPVANNANLLRLDRHEGTSCPMMKKDSNNNDVPVDTAVCEATFKCSDGKHNTTVDLNTMCENRDMSSMARKAVMGNAQNTARVVTIGALIKESEEMKKGRIGKFSYDPLIALSPELLAAYFIHGTTSFSGDISLITSSGSDSSNSVESTKIPTLFAHVLSGSQLNAMSKISFGVIPFDKKSSYVYPLMISFDREAKSVEAKKVGWKWHANSIHFELYNVSGTSDGKEAWNQTGIALKFGSNGHYGSLNDASTYYVDKYSNGIRSHEARVAVRGSGLSDENLLVYKFGINDISDGNSTGVSNSAGVGGYVDLMSAHLDYRNSYQKSQNVSVDSVSNPFMFAEGFCSIHKRNKMIPEGNYSFTFRIGTEDVSYSPYERACLALRVNGDNDTEVNANDNFWTTLKRDAITTYKEFDGGVGNAESSSRAQLTDASIEPSCPVGEIKAASRFVESIVTASTSYSAPNFNQAEENGLGIMSCGVGKFKVSESRATIFEDMNKCYKLTTGASIEDPRSDKTLTSCNSDGFIPTFIHGSAGLWHEENTSDPSVYNPVGSFNLWGGLVIALDAGVPAIRSASTLIEGIENQSNDWQLESSENSILNCPVIPYIRSNGVYACDQGLCDGEGQAISGDIPLLIAKASFSSREYRYGMRDPIRYATRSKQVNLSSSAAASTTVASMADTCAWGGNPNLGAPSDHDAKSPYLVASNEAYEGDINRSEFSYPVGYVWSRGLSRGVTLTQYTPWSSERTDGNLWASPSCEIFDNVDATSGQEEVYNISGYNLEIGNGQNKHIFNLAPLGSIASTLNNDSKTMVRGGRWIKIGEESEELTLDNSKVEIECKIYPSNSSMSDTCDSYVDKTYETVEGFQMTIKGENGEHGGNGGMAIVLVSEKPEDVIIKTSGGKAGKSGSVELDGASSSIKNMTCYKNTGTLETPAIKIYRFNKAVLNVSKGQDGNSGKDGDKYYGWGIHPDAIDWIKRQIEEKTQP